MYDESLYVFILILLYDMFISCFMAPFGMPLLIPIARVWRILKPQVLMFILQSIFFFGLRLWISSLQYLSVLQSELNFDGK